MTKYFSNIMLLLYYYYMCALTQVHSDVVSRRARGGGVGGTGVIEPHLCDTVIDGGAGTPEDVHQARYEMRVRVCRKQATRVMQAIVRVPALRQDPLVRAFFAPDAPFVPRHKSNAKPDRYF